MISDTSDHLTLRSLSHTLWCAPEVSHAAAISIAAAPGNLMRQYCFAAVKIGRESQIVEAELPLNGRAGRTVRVAYKQFRPRSGLKTLVAFFRTNKARLCWQNAQGLHSRGIATPRLLLACWPRIWGGTSSYLATEWIDGSENLHLFGWRIANKPIGQRLRLAALCATDLGRLIGRLHASGICHRDLKPANLLVVEGTLDVTTYIVDLEGMRIGGELSATRRERDLARLAAGLAAHPWITAAICLRFIRAYTAEFPPKSIDWKALWRPVAAHARATIRKKQSRGREVL